MDEEKLILLVQGYPALYDLSHKDYDNNLIKDNMWEHICKELGAPVTETKNKWHLLRAYYRRTLIRRKKSSWQAATKIKN